MVIFLLVVNYCEYDYVFVEVISVNVGLRRYTSPAVDAGSAHPCQPVIQQVTQPCSLCMASFRLSGLRSYLLLHHFETDLSAFSEVDGRS